MSIQAMSRVMADHETDHTARLVLLIMANRAGGDEDICFASVERIAADAAVHTRTVQRAEAALVRSGHLEFVGLHPKYRTNMYRVMPVGRVAESHPPGNPGPDLPPELEVTGVRGSVVGLASSDSDVEPKAPKASTRPTDRQVYLAGRITETWGTTRGKLTIPALQKLNSRFGIDAVGSALGLLKDFPPSEAVESPYAYVESICKQGEAP